MLLLPIARDSVVTRSENIGGMELLATYFFIAAALIVGILIGSLKEG